MIILGIETSCDETSAAIVRDGTEVLCNIIASTKEVFAQSGGVVPEDAARRQVELILPVLHSAIAEAGLAYTDIDAIAVTKGPGLMGSLLVGVMAARTLSFIHNIPLIGVHHTLGHLSSVWLEQEDSPEFPCLTLSVSGGHSDLWLRTSHTDGKRIGKTRDDAAGEAFDKGAAMLGLPYPGGPSISKSANSGDPSAFDFPIALLKEPTCDFSFSGLKNSLRLAVLKHAGDLEKLQSNLAASYQEAICAQLCHRVAHALTLYPDVKEVHVVGGVSANTRLREMLQSTIAARALRTPKTIPYCTDNAAMIAAAGYFLYKDNPKQSLDAFITSTSTSL
ncbi:tRNA (adenosine(37)-N6)-threonylcarbamoyltransferase complex transferase subunit TsaD [Candidatus Peregrinibacteria bacterium]|jgi:N6-L-threonylcarbamoyladenine synthase|nr:tRNA (adenosine(37)-N6)-threonylcarbamoyltransferase complex transferase subunit TsaD [Candidatus Peregrinibacteria bacterium]MBT7337169.1 tRNA (adenosine(37)-N6)-threonylcarbamoyltransferase complex transferase subunit TsaD [Candidatus Peregrinibacteria bacterium]